MLEADIRWVHNSQLKRKVNIHSQKMRHSLLHGHWNMPKCLWQPTINRYWEYLATKSWGQYLTHVFTSWRVAHFGFDAMSRNPSRGLTFIFSIFCPIFATFPIYFCWFLLMNQKLFCYQTISHADFLMAIRNSYNPIVESARKPKNHKTKCRL